MTITTDDRLPIKRNNYQSDKVNITDCTTVSRSGLIKNKLGIWWYTRFEATVWDGPIEMPVKPATNDPELLHEWYQEVEDWANDWLHSAIMTGHAITPVHCYGDNRSYANAPKIWFEGKTLIITQRGGVDG